MLEMSDLLKYGVMGFALAQTIVFLWFWMRRDKEYGGTIRSIDTKHLEQQKDTIDKYSGLSNKYEAVLVENARVMRDVNNSLQNVEKEIARG